MGKRSGKEEGRDEEGILHFPAFPAPLEVQPYRPLTLRIQALAQPYSQKALLPTTVMCAG